MTVQFKAKNTSFKKKILMKMIPGIVLSIPKCKFMSSVSRPRFVTAGAIDLQFWSSLILDLATRGLNAKI
jgi:hypothetical protein